MYILKETSLSHVFLSDLKLWDTGVSLSDVFIKCQWPYARPY